MSETTREETETEAEAEEELAETEAELAAPEVRARADAFIVDTRDQNVSRRAIEESDVKVFRRTRVVLGGFLLVVALAVYAGATIERGEIAQRQAWPTVMGEIRSSKAVSEVGMDIVVYEVHYNAMGQKFRSSVNMQAREGAPRMGDVIALKIDPDDPMRVSISQTVGERVIFSDKAIAIPGLIGGALLMSLLMF